MQFGILGPLEAVDCGGRPVPLGGPKPRTLLAVLLVNANQVVSSDRLIDELWGEHPPPTASNLLQGYISKLRHALLEADGPQVLVTQAPGYVLQLDPGQLDLHRFDGLVSEARQALAEEAFDRAATRLTEALALWRGSPLAGATLGPSTRTEALRLEERRSSVLEERIEADLACGRHAELAGELEALVTQHPLRERLRGQLMVALYRSGRQAEALATYRDARHVLAHELGIEPGPSLQRLEQAILTHDPSLQYARNGAAEGTVAVAPERPAEPGRRKGGGRRRAAVIGCVALSIGLLAALWYRLGWSHPLASARTGPAAGMVVLYDFDEGFDTDPRGNRFAVDSTGHGHAGAVTAGQASDLTIIDRPGQGKAVAFPAPCAPSPTVTCPLAIIEVPDAAALDPGTQDFRYGADVLLHPTQTSADSNIMQKGNANDGDSQWKLRIEDTADGTPSCVVVGKGSTVIYKAISEMTVADGSWHTLLCVKTATTLTIYVDSVNRGQVVLPAGLAIDNNSPVRIGGKNVAANNDNNQFFGTVDNVYFHLDGEPSA